MVAVLLYFDTRKLAHWNFVCAILLSQDEEAEKFDGRREAESFSFHKRHEKVESIRTLVLLHIIPPTSNRLLLCYFLLCYIHATFADWSKRSSGWMEVVFDSTIWKD